MSDVIERTIAAKAADNVQTVAKMIADAVAVKKPLESFPPQKIREIEETSGNYFEPPARDLFSITDEVVPKIIAPKTAEVRESDIPVRIYTPKAKAEVSPALVYFHGGGFVIGSINTHDLVCQNLAAESGYIIISVGYSLAPEAKYPEPGNDAMMAFQWVQANAERLGIDVNNIAVGGDSAGGNLAAVSR